MAEGSTAPNLAAKIKGPLELADLRKMFNEARDLTKDARTDSELSRDYYDGIQLTGAELATIRGRSQPPVIINRIQRAVNGILGVVEQGKTDPRALMRTPPEEKPQPAPPTPGGQMVQQPPVPQLDAGDVASMALRYIADTTHFPSTDMDVLENGIVEGCGAAITEVEGDEIKVKQIRWEEFFYDPYSRRHDFKDARYMGVAKWMYADDVPAKTPESKQVMDRFKSSGNLDGLDASWEDRPESGTSGNWVDGAKRRVMCVELYHSSGGVWYRAVLYAAEVLEYAPSAYLDDDGNPTNPIEAWSAYVNRKNERYGEVKPMRDLQDAINMRYSKALHEINTRQVQCVDPNAPPIDADTARTEAARPDGVLPTGWQIVPRQDVIANNLELLSDAKAELDRMAAAPGLLGRGSADASGRAQQVRQQAGVTELARVLGRHRDWRRRMYGQMWGRARQFWTGPKWIRITNDTDAPQYVQINEPQPHPDPMAAMQGMPGPIKNHIAKMDVDIVLDEVPDTATLEQEVFAELSQLAQVYGPQAVPFEIILEASSLPEKRKLIEKLKAHMAAQAQSQQAAQQLEVGKATADIGKTQADTKLTEVKTVREAMAGHMEAAAAHVMPPGVSEVANLPQNQPQPNGAGV